ncbi:hypothetical protein BCR34DRAFT_438228, partial [Clohesyomyces aquaticus]
QWKSILRELGVFKTICQADAKSVLEVTNQLKLHADGCLILLDGILFDLRDVESHQSRTRTKDNSSQAVSRAKNILIIPLPVRLGMLGNLEFFKQFRRLLWYTGVYFDINFDTRIWTPDDRGVFDRSEILVNGLTSLSNFHNMLCKALKHFGREDEEMGWATVRYATQFHLDVVQTKHHRQFPDLLAIALILERNGREDIRKAMVQHLYETATQTLLDHDVRRHIFETLINLPLDLKGDLYVAFDTFCRQLWRLRAGNDRIKAYYSYNQAGSPRTSPGRFYELFHGESLPNIQEVLRQVDARFAHLDHARFCLWQTAIRYLLVERNQYQEAEIVCRSLLSSLGTVYHSVEYFQQRRQLNVDICLSLYLLGCAQELLGKLIEAMRTFQRCVDLRTLIARNIWDPPRWDALEK